MDKSRVRAQRRYDRYVKMMRRLREDRATHTSDVKKSDPVDWCPCFLTQDRAWNGKTKSYFADTPKACSGFCCGNPRRMGGQQGSRLTMQERRALLGDSEVWG